MKAKSELKKIVERRIDDYKKWLSVTGAVCEGCGWDIEIQCIIEQAVNAGYRAGIKKGRLDERYENSKRNSTILITEEWLLKLGFIQDKDYYWFHYSNGFLKFNLEGKKLYYNLGIAGINKVMLSVHELQNLFYVLTGQELTIKELVN